MKILTIAALLAAGIAGGADAQTPPRRGQPVANPHGNMAAAPRRIQPVASRFSIDTPIEMLIADRRAKAALDRHMPGLSANPRLSMFKKMSIRELAANPHAVIPAARIRALQADLALIR